MENLRVCLNNNLYQRLIYFTLKRFKNKILDDQFEKFLEILKKIHINISFADVLKKIPNYAKFIKNVMSKKRKLQEYET